jgi:hypothetical protein
MSRSKVRVIIPRSSMGSQVAYLSTTGGDDKEKLRGVSAVGEAFSSVAQGCMCDTHISPRQNYLYLSAELTRPCLAEPNFTSNCAPRRQDEASTRGKPPYANLRGYGELIRSA